MFKVSAQHLEGDSDQGPQGIPMTGTAEIYTVSQEAGERRVGVNTANTSIQSISL